MNNTRVPLGKLELISLREAWPNEATNFTPWLAEDVNLDLLGEALGLKLELEAVEKPVGPFSADIVAKDLHSKHWVLIENQIEATDHKHLGQLLTYAAGLDAKIVIWIADAFHENHRAALDFLNKATGEDYHFFGVRIDLFKIGDSDLAPNFSVIAKPNNWSKSAQAAKRATEGQLSKTQILNKDYWTALISKSKNSYPSLANRVPYKGNWQTAERLITNQGLYCEANASFTRDQLRIEAYIGGVLAKAAFDILHSNKSAIEKEFGDELQWEALPKGQDSRVAYYMDGVQKRDNRDQWDNQHQWLLNNWKKLSDTFRRQFDQIDITKIEQAQLKETD